jgi:hypothetical protein
MPTQTQEMTIHRGQCHCGAVSYRFQAPETLDVLDCNCSICTMTSYRHVIIPHTDFTLRSGGQTLIEYRFNTGTARHLFCGLCGIKSFYQPRSHPNAWSVNLNCIAGGADKIGKVTDFDGKNWETAHEAL